MILRLVLKFYWVPKVFTLSHRHNLQLGLSQISGVNQDFTISRLKDTKSKQWLERQV